MLIAEVDAYGGDTLDRHPRLLPRMLPTSRHVQWLDSGVNWKCLRLLAEGRSNRAIADILSLSERTVENHVFHILTKLELESRAAAAAYAVRHGLA